MKVIVFCTYGSSLETWRDAGILERELALYLDHVAAGLQIILVTYGGAVDHELIKPFKGIEVLSNHVNLHPRLYAWLLPILHAKSFKKASLFKTNQMYGAHIAVRCAKIFKKTIIVRQGYGHYEHRVSEYGEGHKRSQEALVYEQRYLQQADIGVFTSQNLADRAVERHRLDSQKIYVVPNYVVKKEWSPEFEAMDTTNGRFRVTFFGRFTAQKNLENLILACRGLPLHLTLIGEGPLQSDLESLTTEHGVSVDFPGRLPQRSIRDILRESDLFALVSHYEGNPKALLEAMMLGMPILASNGPGLSNVIIDKKTALVCGIEADDIREKLKLLMSDIDLRSRLGKEAQLYAEQHYGLEEIAKKERLLFSKAVGNE